MKHNRTAWIVIIHVILLFVGRTGLGAQPLYSLHMIHGVNGDLQMLSTLSAAEDSLRTDDTISLMFGGLLGNTDIVEYDSGETFFDAAGQAQIDFIIPSIPEFRYGVSRLKQLSALGNTPHILAANIIDTRDRSTVFEPMTLEHVGGRKICIVGLADPDIMRDSADESILGVDIIPPTEALRLIMLRIVEEQPDVVIMAGGISRSDIIELARQYINIDIFVTTRSDTFDQSGATRTASVDGKPVLMVPKTSTRMGIFNTTLMDGIESQEFIHLPYLEVFDHDPVLEEKLTSIIQQLNLEQQYEKSIVKTGLEVTSILREVFHVDAVLIERQSLYYYPIDDSLTVTDVEKVIKPYSILKAYDLNGLHLKSILQKSGEESPERKLHIAGISQDAKIDSLPIQDDHTYRILTTTFLRLGGHDYQQFTNGTGEVEKDIDMLQAAESYLVAKEERLREAMKPKNWELKLHLDIGSYLNKQDVNQEKDNYGSNIPKPFRDQKDNFLGNFKVESWNNTFRYAKNSHQYDMTLHMKYVRSGTRTDDGNIQYSEADDNLILYNKYTFNHPKFAAKPYIDNTVNSELYNSSGKHPIYTKVTTGLTRKFPVLFNMVLNVGFSADRNYLTNDNGFGVDSKITFDKSFEGNSYLTKNTALHSETIINYKPMARYYMAFYLQNRNNLSIQLMKKIEMTFNVNSYLYRDTTFRNMAIGVFYDFSLNYAMDWDY